MATCDNPIENTTKLSTFDVGGTTVAVLDNAIDQTQSLLELEGLITPTILLPAVDAVSGFGSAVTTLGKLNMSLGRIGPEVTRTMPLGRIRESQGSTLADSALSHTEIA